MTRALLATLLAGALAHAGGIPPIRPTPTLAPPRAEVTRFANGLELWTVADPAVPLVSVVIAVRGAGSAADPPAQVGLASLTVDLLDEGRRPGSGVDVIEELEARGGSLRAWVTEESATLALSTLTRSLPAGLELLYLLCAAPPYGEADVARVREEHLDDLRLRPDRPGEIAGILLDQALFGANTAYGRPRLGSLATVSPLGLAEVRAFHRAHYRPDQMVLVVVGDFDRAALEAIVARTFAAWPIPPSPAPPLPEVPPGPPTPALVAIDLPGSSQAHLRLGVRGLARSDRRADALDVLAMALGGSFGSLLNRRLREELGLTYGAEAYATFLMRTGRFVVSTDVDATGAVRALREILALLRRLGARPLAPAELQRTKDTLIHSIPRWFDTHARTAETLSSVALHGLGPRWLEGYPAAIRAVTADDVQRVARDLLERRRLGTVILGDLDAIGPGLERLGLGKLRRVTSVDP